MTEIIPGGRPGIPAPDKPRQARRPHRHKRHAPFLHEHPLARHTLKGHPPAPEPPPEKPTDAA